MNVEVKARTEDGTTYVQNLTLKVNTTETLTILTALRELSLNELADSQDRKRAQSLAEEINNAVRKVK